MEYKGLGYRKAVELYISAVQSRINYFSSLRPILKNKEIPLSDPFHTFISRIQKEFKEQEIPVCKWASISEHLRKVYGVRPRDPSFDERIFKQLEEIRKLRK